MMWIALATMLLTVLPFTESFAPRVNGSRRFLLGRSIQPSEFAKLAVIAWTAMLVVKKGVVLRRSPRGSSRSWWWWARSPCSRRSSPTSRWR
jgi:cell division protein FtsW